MTRENCFAKSINTRLKTFSLYPLVSHKQAEKLLPTPLVDKEMEVGDISKW